MSGCENGQCRHDLNAKYCQGCADDFTERTIVDGENGERLALEVAALTKLNQRQVALVQAAEAKAEEQRLSSDAGWERVHKLEDERNRYKAALEYARDNCDCESGVVTKAREALKGAGDE